MELSTAYPITSKTVFQPIHAANGWKSTEHIQAFGRYVEHCENCPECQKPGVGVELDDGIQPTMNNCSIADQLFKEFQSMR